MDNLTPKKLGALLLLVGSTCTGLGTLLGGGDAAECPEVIVEVAAPVEAPVERAADVKVPEATEE